MGESVERLKITQLLESVYIFGADSDVMADRELMG
jgi:hypothetical protein